MEINKDDLKQIIESFSQVMKSLHQHSYQKMDELKLYPGQPKLLALINANEGITQKELAKKNFVKPSTVTGMLNKLEANRYIYRMPDETDKRIMRVYLTKEGKQFAEKGEVYLKELTIKMFENFTPEELKIYIMLTNKIKDNLQNLI